MSQREPWLPLDAQTGSGKTHLLIQKLMESLQMGAVFAGGIQYSDIPSTSEIHPQRSAPYRQTYQQGLDPQEPWGRSNFEYLWRKLNASSDEIKESIAMDVRVMHGNPVFRGTRIPIYTIVDEFADGATLPGILEGYPSLTAEQIQNALEFTTSLLRIYNDQIPD
jgi:uncharacterized protein (DUF433 family)